jgi:hypothetical protein
LFAVGFRRSRGPDASGDRVATFRAPAFMPADRGILAADFLPLLRVPFPPKVRYTRRRRTRAV